MSDLMTLDLKHACFILAVSYIPASILLYLDLFHTEIIDSFSVNSRAWIAIYVSVSIFLVPFLFVLLGVFI